MTHLSPHQPPADTLPGTTLTTIEAATAWLHAHGWNTNFTANHEATDRYEAFVSTRVDRLVDGLMEYKWCHDDAEVIVFAQRQERALVNEAAPELLAALKQMQQVVDVLAEGIGRLAPPAGFFALFNDATVAAAQAIRKAEARND